MSESLPELSAGQVFAGWRVESELARGGMGVLYLARHPRLPRTDVIKVLSPFLGANERFRERFLREVDRMSTLSHPHVMPIHDSGEAEDGTLYLVMPLISGGDLRGLLRKNGPIPPARAVRLITQLGAALDAAHRIGVVHRDVKPENVMLSSVEPEDNDHVLLTDFGISREQMAENTLTATGELLLTPAYAAPEQVLGKTTDARADQYAMACILYELLTGVAPFVDDAAVVMLMAHIQNEVPLIADAYGFPPAIDAVLAKAMAKSPDDRYATCREFAQAAGTALQAPATTDPLTTADLPAKTMVAGTAVDAWNTPAGSPPPPPSGSLPGTRPLSGPPSSPPPSGPPGSRPPSGPPPSAPPPYAPAGYQPPPPAPRKRWPLVVGAVVVVAAIGGVIAAVAGGGGSKDKVTTSPSVSPSTAGSPSASSSPTPSASPSPSASASVTPVGSAAYSALLSRLPSFQRPNCTDATSKLTPEFREYVVTRADCSNDEGNRQLAVTYYTLPGSDARVKAFRYNLLHLGGANNSPGDCKTFQPNPGGSIGKTGYYDVIAEQRVNGQFWCNRDGSMYYLQQFSQNGTRVFTVVKTSAGLKHPAPERFSDLELVAPIPQ